MHQIKDVIAGDARQIKKLREDQHDQHGDRAPHLRHRQRRGRGLCLGLADMAGISVPAPEPRQDHHAGKRCQRKPRQARLAARQNEEGRRQRAERIAEIAADLKQRLGKTMRAARRRAGEPRGFRMEDRRAEAQQRGACKEHEEPRREGRDGEPNERAGHAERQRIGLRPMIGIEADDGLQQRSDALVNERDQADLPETSDRGYS